MSNLLSIKRPLRSVHIAGSTTASPSVDADLHAAALEKAREEGFQDGKREAESAYAEALDRLKQFQTSILQDLSKAEDALFKEAEKALPELILQGVHRIIQDWKPKAEEVERLVLEALESLEGDSGPVRVFLSPEDKKHMLSLHKDLERDFPEVTILEDSQLQSGECYVRGRFGITDGRFAAKLENMRKVFL